jgi:hypothetical protein
MTFYNVLGVMLTTVRLASRVLQLSFHLAGSLRSAISQAGQPAAPAAATLPMALLQASLSS